MSKDGTIFPVEISGRFFIRQGRSVRIAAIRDITERTRAEEALQESEERLKKAQEVGHIGSWELDLSTNRIWGSEEAFRVYGLERTSPDLPFEVIQECVLPEYRPLVEKAFEQHISQGGKYDMELQIRRKSDGALRFLHSIAELIVDDTGKSIKISGVIQDITERQQAEEALRASEGRFRTIAEQMKDVIFLTDTKGSITFISPAARECFGFNPEEMIGHPFMEFLSEQDIPKAVEAFYRDISTTSPSDSLELKMKRKNGSTFSGELRSTLYLRDGIAGTIGTIHDITERQQVEEALRESEERFHSLFMNTSIGLYRTTPDGRILLANPALLLMLGYDSFEELSSRNLENEGIEPKYPRSEFRRRIESEAEVRGLEAAWKRKDGVTIFVRENAKAIRDRAGTVLYYEGTVEDITESKRVQEALRESEERFRKIFEDGPTGMATLDADFHFLKANSAFCSMLGYSEKELQSLTFKDLTHPDHLAEDIANVGKLLRGEIPLYRTEKRYIKKNNEVVWGDVVVTIIRDAAGQFLYSLAQVVNITERKRNEEVLSRLNQAVQSSGEVVLMCDREGVITFINKAFTDVYGYEPDEIIGKATPRILDSGMESEDTHETFWKTLLEKQTFTKEYRNKTKDGRLVSVEIAANPIVDAQGNVTGFLTVQRDMTERKRAQEEYAKLQNELFQAQKLESIGTLAAGIAHDFNNILGIILGYNDLLKRGNPDPDFVRQATGIIGDAVDRGAGLVKQILTFARQSDAVFGPLSINIMIKEVSKMFAETFPKTIVVDLELAKDAPSIEADAAQIHQLLLNLSVNARDAMPNGGKLTIATEVVDRAAVQNVFPEASEKTYVHLSVSDTGTGMSEEVASHIFEPFFTTKPKGKGTGLGLSVVYGVVKKHRGHIRVESALNKGTTFHIYLPANTEDANKRKRGEDSNQNIAGGSETILFVEDELPLSELMIALLQMKGYRIIHAKDGKEAMKLYEQNKDSLSLVLSDMGLPEASGMEVFTFVRSKNPNAKFIIASGYIDPEQESDMIKAGVSAVLEKPYEPGIVLKTVRNVLDGIA